MKSVPKRSLMVRITSDKGEVASSLGFAVPTSVGPVRVPVSARR